LLVDPRGQRAATIKNRRASVIKKAQELSILCGVNISMMISGVPDDPTPLLWPPSPNSDRILTRFKSRSKELQIQKLTWNVADAQREHKKAEREAEVSKDMFPAAAFHTADGTGEPVSTGPETAQRGARQDQSFEVCASAEQPSRPVQRMHYKGGYATGSCALAGY
jgi:SRF-type transcription factor (DNA-binding and dimerisation domain)